MWHRSSCLRRCEDKMKKNNIKNLLFLHIIFIWYSFVGIFSKNAAKYPFLSWDYLKWYVGVIFVMGIYAILWQQALKRMPLTIAYANKAIVTVWSVLWGALFWAEKITIGKVLGTLVIVIGIILVVTGEKKDDQI